MAEITFKWQSPIHRVQSLHMRFLRQRLSEARVQSCVQDRSSVVPDRSTMLGNTSPILCSGQVISGSLENAISTAQPSFAVHGT
eukprot:10682405-Alexandrium_andersonii.AAC.1